MKFEGRECIRRMMICDEVGWAPLNVTDDQMLARQTSHDLYILDLDPCGEVLGRQST